MPGKYALRLERHLTNRAHVGSTLSVHFFLMNTQLRRQAKTFFTLFTLVTLFSSMYADMFNHQAPKYEALLAKLAHMWHMFRVFYAVYVFLMALNVVW